MLNSTTEGSSLQGIGEQLVNGGIVAIAAGAGLIARDVGVVAVGWQLSGAGIGAALRGVLEVAPVGHLPVQIVTVTVTWKSTLKTAL